MSQEPVRVIFACVHSAGRSQMAAALFSRLADPTRAVALSAGTDPALRVHPEVVESMSELGIDLSEARPRLFTVEVGRHAGMVVTMGCGDQCPIAPGARHLDWPLADPKGQPPEVVRAIRDQIRDLVVELVRAEGWAR